MPAAFGKRGGMTAAAVSIQESPSVDEEEQSPRRQVGNNLFKRLFFCYADEDEDEDEEDTDEESEEEVEAERKLVPRADPRIVEPKVSGETRHYAVPQPHPAVQEAAARVVVVPAAQPPSLLRTVTSPKSVETAQAEVAALAELSPPPVAAAARAVLGSYDSTDSAASTLVVPVEPQRPDFTGAWILDRIEGDMDAYATDCGVPWAKRKMAGSMGWGVGSSVVKFAHNGDRTVIISETPRGTQVQDLVVNGERQQVPNLMTGEPIEVTPYWDGDCLVVDTLRERIRRSLRDGELLVEMQTFKGGVRVVRIHKRR